MAINRDLALKCLQKAAFALTAGAMFSPATQRLVQITLLTFAGYFLLGYGGIFAWGGNSHSTSPIWPATAFGFVMMIRLSRSRRDDIAMAVAMLAAGLGANLLGGAPPVLSLGYMAINVLDVLAGIFAFRHLASRRITGLASLARFALAAGISPSLFGAFLAAALVAWYGGDAMITGTQWFLANLLGAIILLPFGLTASLRQFAKLKLQHRFLEAMTLFVALAAASVAGFKYDYPVLFLVLVLSMIAAARFRLLGAGAALLVVSTLAFAAVRTLPQSHTLAWVEILQFYLATVSAVSVCIAVLMNERDFHVAIIERRHRRAVRASRFKSQLLSHVSHEVRSPLSAIIGFSAMLESGSLPAQRAPEFAAIIAHNGELLQRLHDDLLDLSRAEAGALVIQAERVAVGASLQTCIEGIRLDATLGGKEVLVDRIEDALAVQADPVRLAQILNNLIANAFKYGDNFSPIRVSAHARPDGFGRIEIVNSGPGIPAAERGAVFLPFRRSQSVGRSVPGAGLGLSIAKLLVEAQGGRIDFESEPGRQTRFWIDLPLAA